MTRVFAVLAIMIIAAFALLVTAINSISLPVDEGQELSRLATAGIMRGSV